jgi:hypothetical protein
VRALHSLRWGGRWQVEAEGWAQFRPHSKLSLNNHELRSNFLFTFSKKFAIGPTIALYQCDALLRLTVWREDNAWSRAVSKQNNDPIGGG